VAAIDRSEKGLEQLRRRKWAGRVHAFACDLGDVGATGQTAQRILKEQGPVRTLVNNAGIWYYTPIEKTPDEYWQHTLNVNLVSAAALVRAFVPGMKEMRGGAAIVNTSSRNALSSSPKASTYDASKAALLGFTRTMAVELGPYGIRANAVCPGVIDTPANKAEIADPQFVENYLRLIPLNRFGKPEDMANVIYFLASDEAAFVTGQHIVADGGQMSGQNYSRIFDITQWTPSNSEKKKRGGRKRPSGSGKAKKTASKSKPAKKKPRRQAG
jgi:NAD(P)-dependent dehydrogenase (short-subunit alcohol dehydrogenase family)